MRAAAAAEDYYSVGAVVGADAAVAVADVFEPTSTTTIVTFNSQNDYQTSLKRTLGKFWKGQCSRTDSGEKDNRHEKHLHQHICLPSSSTSDVRNHISDGILKSILAHYISTVQNHLKSSALFTGRR